MNRTERTFITLGAVSALVAVSCGAFAAHGLKGRLTPEMLAIFDTGARYQLSHALGLLGIGLVAGRTEAHAIARAGWLLVAGTVLFSGSLYLLALTGVGVLGAITPLGGLCFLAGWGTLAAGVWRSGSTA